MLLPSLSAAREQAKQTKCLANIRAQLIAGVSYSQEDPSEYILPVHARFRSAEIGKDCYSLQSYLSSARMSYGGKSGAHDYDGERCASLVGKPTIVTADPTTGYGRYTTGNGMGPATRPMNAYLFRGSFADRMGMSVDEMRSDEQIEMDVFRCPSDRGYNSSSDGGGVYGIGIYMGREEWHSDERSFYDVVGNSYGTNSTLLPVPNSPRVLSIGPWLRPYSQIPSSSMTTVSSQRVGAGRPATPATTIPRSARPRRRWSRSTKPCDHCSSTCISNHHESRSG
jgi:hypothetical protein